jgi:ribosomal protein L37AE/L43A
MIAMRELELPPSLPHAAAAPISAAARRLCPYCRSVEVARSHRRGPIEKYLLRAIHVRVYRCDDCNSRFYGFAHSEAVVPPKNHAA